MKTSRFVFACALSVIASACGNHPQQAADSTSNTIALNSLPEYFYKRYEGTIAGQPVVMHLYKEDNRFDGIYSYRKTGMWMQLYQDSTGRDTLYLSEYFSGDTWSGDASVKENRLHCVLDEHTLKGWWISNDGKKTYEINLKETYPEGSYPFTLLEYNDSTVAWPGMKESPVARTHYLFPVPEQGNAWLEQQIKRVLGMDSNTTASYKDGIDEMNASYFKDYTSNLPDLKDTADGMPLASYNYDASSDIYIRYNDHGIVVLEATIYAYEGGAHGNYGSSLYCFDVMNQRLLKLNDIITADSATLQPIVEKAFRTQYHITADSLNEVLFDNYLAVNDNFYITDNGIGFIYNPYEVASYAQGQINVFIPFKSLDAFLVPAFRQKIKPR